MKIAASMIVCIIIALSIIGIQYLINPADVPSFMLILSLLVALVVGWKYGQSIDIEKNKADKNYLLKRFMMTLVLGMCVFGTAKGLQFYYEKVASIFLFRYAISSNKDKMMLEADSFIVTDPILIALRQTQPKAFKEHYNKLHDVAASMTGPSDLAEFAQAFSKLLLFSNEIFSQKLKTATDESIVNYLKANLKLLKYVNAFDPKSIAALESRGAKVDFEKLNQHPEFKDLFDGKALALNEIFTSSNPPIKIDEKESAKLYEDIIKEIAKEHSEESVKLTLSPTANLVPALTSSQIILDFYERCLQLEPKQCAMVGRYYLQKRNENISVKLGSSPPAK